ncbi:MAG: hypothetical protein IT318_09145 [Anaerolineales bacterium]|nr:hypothetical protein [Anaerolineales bacterium]
MQPIGKAIRLAIIAGIFTTACGPILPGLQTGQPSLALAVKLSMAAEGQASVQIGVRNEGSADFAGSDTFGGLLEVREVTGELRLAATTSAIGPVPAGEAVYPAVWTGQFDPGDYRLTWQARGTETAAVDFSIVDQNGILLMEAPAGCLDPMTDFTRAAP